MMDEVLDLRSGRAVRLSQFEIEAFWESGDPAGVAGCWIGITGLPSVLPNTPPWLGGAQRGSALPLSLMGF